MFCSSHYLLGDLSYELQEEIIDAFQDVRVSAGTEIIKQGDVADNFYIIVSMSFLTDRLLSVYVFASIYFCLVACFYFSRLSVLVL